MKRTARMIAYDCIEDNHPIDRHWVKHVTHGMTQKEKLDWARNNIEPYADGCSANKITRAAKMLLFYLHV